MQFNYIPLKDEKEEKITFGNNLKLEFVDKESEWSDCASDETRSTSSYASKSSKREKSDSLCRDFLSGKCTRSQKQCRYVHKDAAEHAEEQKANGACRRYFNKFYCPLGVTCKFTHDAEWLVEQRAKNGQCKFFIQGDCRAGEACTRNHEAKFKIAYKMLK